MAEIHPVLRPMSIQSNIEENIKEYNSKDILDTNLLERKNVFIDLTRRVNFFTEKELLMSIWFYKLSCNIKP